MKEHDATEIAYKNGYDEGLNVLKRLLKAKSNAEVEAIVQKLKPSELREQVRLLVAAYNQMIVTENMKKITTENMRKVDEPAK